MYFDGSLMLDGVGARMLLISPSGDRLCYVLQLEFWATNNVMLSRCMASMSIETLS